MNLRAPAAAVILVFLCTSTLAHAATSRTIHTTVGVNVCGNGAVERPAEDCEGSNLHGGTCQNQGYGPGTLTCDIACSYDTFGCASPSPHPSPSPSSSPTPTATATTTTNNSSDSEAPPVGSGRASTVPIEVVAPRLPTPLAALDPNGDGTISIAELYTTVKSWVGSWRASIGSEGKTTIACDINGDKSCDIIDLSLLLYYIER